MRQILRPFYILALNTNDERESHILLNEGITRAQFKVLQGSYKGVKETSYLLDADFKDEVLKLAKEYKQESILFVDETRQAFLIYLNDTSTSIPLGEFKAISNISNLDAYTVDIQTGQAYAAI